MTPRGGIGILDHYRYIVLIPLSITAYLSVLGCFSCSDYLHPECRSRQKIWNLRFEERRLLVASFLGSREA